jgi:hypothetical protein
MPEIAVLTPAQSFEVYNAIILLERTVAKVESYRGLSHSRITGELLGCKEYYFAGWVWPGDFAKHYVLNYRVKPTDEFLEFLGVKL